MAAQGEVISSLKQWAEWLESAKKSLCPRGNAPLLKKDLATALTGVRRGGKTTCAVEWATRESDRVLYYNFEDPLFFGSSSPSDLDQLVMGYEEIYNHPPQVVVFDEIHQIEGWERWARKAVDLQKFKLVITGSSSRLLSSEISTSISGRALETTVWPLSFREFLEFRNKKPTSSPGLLRELDHYLKWGGFPKVVLTEHPVDQVMLLKQYLSDIVHRDVLARNQIRDRRSLEQLVSWYLTNLSCTHSYTSIRKAFGLSIESASRLTRHLNDAFLVFEVNRYHPNMKVQARDPKKVYIIDNGLRTVTLQSHREDLGRLAENCVYIELRRRGLSVQYFKQESEVDFVITELGHPVQAIQVTYGDLSEETKKRELAGIVEAMTALDLHEGTILTRQFSDRVKLGKKTVHFIALHQWIL